MLETVGSLVLTILSLLVIIIFVGSIYAFFYAIFQFIFSAGDPEKIKKAWNSIRFMILGIILTIAFLFVFPIIFKRMNVPGHEEYTASNIFQTATYLTRQIFNFGREAFTEGSVSTQVDRAPSSSPPPRSNNQDLEL